MVHVHLVPPISMSQRRGLLRRSRRPCCAGLSKVLPHAPSFLNPFLGTCSRFHLWAQKHFATALLDAIFRGIGQVFFANSPVTGVLVLVGLLLADHYSGLLGLLGCAAGTATGVAITGSFSPALKAGLFGFNGQLVGMAVGVFVRREDSSGSFSGPIVVACAVGLTIFHSVLSAFICVSLSKTFANLRLPYLTLPFNIAALWLLAGKSRYALLGPSDTPSEVPAADACLRFSGEGSDVNCLSGLDLVFAAMQAVSEGISEVFIVSDWRCGILITVGIWCASRRTATFAVLGSAVGALTAHLLGCDGREVTVGLWGYNSALTCAAIGGG